jgi:hypothetical protein
MGYVHCYGCGKEIHSGRVLISAIGTGDEAKIVYFSVSDDCIPGYNKSHPYEPLRGREVSTEELSEILERVERREALARTNAGGTPGDDFFRPAEIDIIFDR